MHFRGKSREIPAFRKTGCCEEMPDLDFLDEPQPRFRELLSQDAFQLLLKYCTLKTVTMCFIFYV